MSSKIKTIVFSDLITSLFNSLSKREADVLMKRNSLKNFPKCTLEQIGKEYNITRERVRQIENEGLKKVKNIDFNKGDIPISVLEAIISEYVNAYGGVIAEDHLLEALLEGREEAEARALNFILTHIFTDKFDTIKPGEGFKVVWFTPGTPVNTYVTLANELRSYVESRNAPATIEALINVIKSHQDFKVINSHKAKNEQIIESLLRLYKDLDKNILNEWGLNSWKTIRPKRMTDKAYLIMKRERKPLHFEEITNLINEAHFDKKKACPATVHNELILDDKYVLVGRGLYGLKEDGYESGTVSDLISKLLQDNGPMEKKDIADKVLDQRIVQKTTITLALMKKDKFKRLEDGRYAPA